MRVYFKIMQFKIFIFFPHIFQLYQVLNGKKIIFSFNFSIFLTKHTYKKKIYIFYHSIFLLFKFSFPIFFTLPSKALIQPTSSFFLSLVLFTSVLRSIFEVYDCPSQQCRLQGSNIASSLETAMCLNIVPNTCYANFML